MARLLKLMETSSPTGVINTHFNIGNADEIAIKMLAEKNIALTDSRSKMNAKIA